MTTIEDIGSMVTGAVRAHSMNSARTAQSLDNRLGASEIGMCRSYLQRVIQQEERREEENVPWAAFIGTALGDFLESAVSADNPTVIKQTAVTATLPSGLRIPGHVDLYEGGELDEETEAAHGGWVLDFKAKDGLTVITRGEVDRAHLYQIVLYWLALVQAGLIGRDAKAFIVYVDRSGKNPDPVVKEVENPESYLAEIDDWLDDVLYAVRNRVEASRDRPYEWCMVACPFFHLCRGADEFHAEGLIEDPDLLVAVQIVEEAKATIRAAEIRKEEATEALRGVSGTTGTHAVSWTHVGSSDVTYTRRPYSRLNIRPLAAGGAK